MTELVDRAARMAKGQRKLALLLEANRVILSELSLGAVLHRIVVAARELAEARYAALGVLAADGSLEQFLHDGLGDTKVCAVGDLPRGDGLLGVLVADPRPLRLERLSEHPASVGTPDTHPDMESFLGVPIEVRGAVYGNLYLTEREGGGPFTDEDETVILALAATAGVAVENARLFEESRRRSRWAEASAEVSSSLLDPAAGDDPVQLVATTVLRLIGADVVSVVVPTDRDTFRVRLAVGDFGDGLEGVEYDAADTIAGLALRTGRGVRLASLPEQPRFTVHLERVMDVGPVLALPLHGSEGTHGVLIVARTRGAAPFDLMDLDLSEAFAAQAAIALELAAARADQQRLVVLEDRERIARDLHDHVIQRLFASGLTLEGVAASADPATAARVGAVVDDLDVTIQQIRTLVFRLQAPGASRSVRSVVLEAAEEAATVLGVEPEVVFAGPVDTVADADVVDDVAAVAREALSNVVRHAQATHVQVRVSVASPRLRVLVADDGVGPGSGTRRSGLLNLTRRAERHHGGCRLQARPGGGTELEWWTRLP
jgi:signal transduction histidine kinase